MLQELGMLGVDMAASSKRGSGAEGGADEDGEEEEEEEEEEEDGALLGFMFGNVDDSGDLDEEYLDQEAKDHLAGLTGTLQKSLLDLKLSSKAGAQVEEEDYNRKADDAIDFEDIDEQYEGPEVQMQAQEQKYYAAAALLAPAAQKIEEEENYDEDEEGDVTTIVPVPQDVQDQPLAELQEQVQVPEALDVVEEPAVAYDAPFTMPQALDDECEDEGEDANFEDEDAEFSSADIDDEAATNQLPVLFQEDGKEVLQFSEIFGIKQPFWMGNKKLRAKRSYKGRPGKLEPALDDDEAELLKTLPPNYDPERSLYERDKEMLVDEAAEQEGGRDRFLAGEPMSSNIVAVTENGPPANFAPVHQCDWESSILWQDSDEEPSANCEGLTSLDKVVALEPLSQRPSSGSRRDIIRRHPQMLRLESWRQPSANLSKKLDKLNLDSFPKNGDLAAGTWLADVCWDTEDLSKVRRAKTIYDFTDFRMVFELLDTKESKTLREHAAAMVVTPTGKEKTSEPVLPTRFNISHDKYYTTKKTPQQQKAPKKRTAHGLKIAHSVPALKLQTMKPKLSNKDLANFHRPKATWFPHLNEVAARKQGELPMKGPMKVILKTLGGKGTKLNVDASDTLETFKSKASKKITDLKPSEKAKVIYLGKELEEGKTFAEQGVRANSVLHLVRTKVHPWPKANRVLDENKPTRPPGAFKKKSELSVKDGRVALMEYCEERPLLLNNVGMGAVFATYYRKTEPVDTTASILREKVGPSIGAVIPLEPSEESPFLGDIRRGQTQSSLETNMYRAPTFQHRPASTDFLLVRSAKGKLSIRRIDRLHIVGQQEPHVEVMAPSSKGVLSYLGSRLQVYVYREFRAKEKPGMPLPQIGAEELMAQFPALTDAFIRKRLKNFADLQRGPNGDMRWVMRSGFRIPTEEELRRMVSPENVCSYESMQAGIHHLKRMGVRQLTQPAGLSAAMNQLPDEALALAAATHIERELQLTPWNLSSSFVTATMQGRNGIERLEITGAGDPTGKGLGFSYLRAAARPPNAGAMVEKKAAAARGGGAVTGTDADLRRLSMDAAREVLLQFGVSEQVIEGLTRWHRIAMVRKLSSEQAANGSRSGAAVLNKYARGQRLPTVHMQQQTRHKCQDIWDRQAHSLAALDYEEPEMEDCPENDLDSFVLDLENLLAEQGDDKDNASKKDKREIRGLGGRRRMQAQQEEEEDEAAEAAEFHRMLMADDEEDEKKRKQSAAAPTPSEQSNVPPTPLPVENPPAPSPAVLPVGATKSQGTGKKVRKIIKRIVKKKQPDGTITKVEVIITDPKEIEAIMKRKAEMQKIPLKKPTVVVKKSKDKKPGGTTPRPMLTVLQNKGQTKEGPQVVCGACGQQGHMRTNKKKCPRYQDEAGAATPRPEAAADVPLPKITVKRDNHTPAKPPAPSPAPVRARSGPSSPAPPAVSRILKLKLPETPKPTTNIATPNGLKIKVKTPKPQAEGGEKRQTQRPRPEHEDQKSEQRRVEEPRFQQEVGDAEQQRKRLAENEGDAEKKRKRLKIKEHKKERQKEEATTSSLQVETTNWEMAAPPAAPPAATAPPKLVVKKPKKRPEPDPLELEPSKRRKAGEVDLANILEGVIEHLKQAACAYLFVKPVTKKEAPDYRKVIKRPMDLSTMKERAKRLQYRSRQEFLVDMQQIVNNAHKYNDLRNPEIPPLADALLSICHNLLRERQQALFEAEQRIETPG